MIKLINIEGIDCVGKTTMSKLLAARLCTETGTFWQAEHEPGFSSAEADKLNFNEMDPWQREYFFLKDRMLHQHVLKQDNTVLDRYILTGLAYTQTYSPEVIPMMKAIYRMPSEFKQPDMIIFMDMEPEDAIKLNELKKGTLEYNAKVTLNKLQTLRVNFKLHLNTIREWEIPFAIVEPVVGDLPATLEKIFTFIKPHI